jgi:hypothetical protein
MSYSAMHFIYPQMLPPWEFMPFLPVYYVCPPNQFHMQSMAAFQNDATLGNGMPQPIPQHLHQNHLLSAGPHQDPIDQRGRRRTAAPPNNNPHASSSSISNDHRNVSHHGQMGDFSNARSGLAGHLSLSTMPSYEHRSRATPRRTKRASAIRGHHIRKDVAQFVVAADGVEGMWDSNFHPLSTNFFFDTLQVDVPGRDTGQMVS